jgi:DNA-binding transcriptional regulator YiaG
MVIHQDAEGLHRLGIISDAEMREFDEDCLVKEPEESYAAEPSAALEQGQSPLALSVGN